MNQMIMTNANDQKFSRPPPTRKLFVVIDRYNNMGFAFNSHFGCGSQKNFVLYCPKAPPFPTYDTFINIFCSRSTFSEVRML